jgi:hypothetical protein
MCLKKSRRPTRLGNPDGLPCDPKPMPGSEYNITKYMDVRGNFFKHPKAHTGTKLQKIRCVILRVCLTRCTWELNTKSYIKELGANIL